MSYNKDQNEFPLPAGKPVQRKSEQHLPRFFRSQANSKFLSSTLDQLLQPGVAEKLNGYIGRKTANAFSSEDNYIDDVSKQRADYQLEPASVIKDDLGNINFYKDYNDFINQIKSYQGDVDNHSRLNSQEYYAWDPQISWDKFANFREYYWLPTGPQSVPVFGQTQEITSTYTVQIADNVDNYAYLLTPDGLTQNASIKLYRGITYKFDINTPGLPFSIKTKRTLDSEFLVEGIDQGVEEGVIEFTPGPDTPDTLYYVADNAVIAGGLIKIANLEEATFIDVESEIIGKKNYTTSAGWSFSNGLKVYFQGDVTPAKYAEGAWYVEGVGDAIKLIAETDLEVPTAFTQDIDVEFDAQGFDRLPFDEAIGYPATKDYIVINRASIDGNLWSRYNRWFHRSVIETSAEINDQPTNVDQSARATRPIIEFKDGLKLYQFGTKTKSSVDLIDDFTVDVFSEIEGSQGYNIDGVDLVEGMRILFTADTDILVKNRIFLVNFINFASGGASNRQIHLVETDDSLPVENETVLVKNGTEYKGKMFYYNGTVWNLAQDKSTTNQAPLFDLFDSAGNSFADSSVYEATDFSGNKLFSYKQGTGTADSELGFALSYRSIENVGDINFNFNLINEQFSYQQDNEILTKNTDNGFIRRYTDISTFTSTSGWTKAKTDSEQPVIRQYVFDNTSTTFAIDVYDNSGLLSDLWTRVYLNNELQFENQDYVIENSVTNIAQVRFLNDLSINDVVLIKTKSSADKNSNGYYEISNNFERNPLNENINEFTLGEINDHVSSIVENLDEFTGTFPGVGNLRDLSECCKYGRRFVKHSAPANFAVYHITDKDANMVKAIKYARREYGKFKRVFLQTANSLGYEGPVKTHVDKIFAEINKDKNSNMPFYFSDMVPTGAAKVNRYTVEDDQEQFFALSEVFDISEPSNKAVEVYLNESQLVYNKDYTFNDDGFCVISADLQRNDSIVIYEYESTNGSFVPPTPTKLGIYPKFEPAIFTDNTYQTPTTVIQGHDGSVMIGYNDFRDNLLLELELRIYNNLKTSYDTDLFDIHDYVNTDDRNTGFDRNTIEKPMLSDFIQWSKLVDEDYTVNDFFSRDNSFTWNYSSMTSPNGNPLPGFWRAVYKDAFDTDRPHTHPWEMLGFSIKPTWWEDQYGPAPYTRDNLILWEDLEKGIIREPGKKFVVNKNYIRTGLTGHIPVDSNGNLLSPSESGYAKNFNTVGINRSYVFGDQAPVETAWRRSSEYPFALITSWLINQPHTVLSTGFDRIRQIRNIDENIIYSTTGKQITAKDIVFPTAPSDTVQVYTSGLINYVADYFASNVATPFEDYKEKFTKIQNQIGAKIGGFTDKNKFRLILDSRTPLNEGNVFVPDENYNIILNTSSPIETVSYSGVIIEKRPSGFIVRGYDNVNPTFYYNEVIELDNDPLINVGGISENFLIWDSNRLYVVGSNVEYEGNYYRVTEQHTSGPSFDNAKFAKLPALPLVGGRSVFFRKKYRNTTSEIPYGTEFETIQQVVDFMLGYENYLKNKGFVFDYYDQDNQVVADWKTSAKEFMFWTLQNWGTGSVITLSPAAFQLKFQTEYAVVDNIFDSFYGYTLLKADGKKLVEEFTSLGRQNPNEFILKPKNTADGIFAVKLPLVQKEHVIILDNRTEFGDIIYDRAPGYRQERIRVLGYRTVDWDGSINIPGFLYDDAKTTEWEQWKDYSIGDVVKYKEFFYSANSKVPGSSTFDSNLWNRLPEKPKSGLLTNFEYKTNQFADFYDLDSDNFDVEQQKFAQHLIGYQNRKYLENIINDDVSQYKFYQGFIQDKGTRNALTKLFDALSSADKDSLDFYEEWAIKAGQYGAADGFDEVEYLLDETQFRLSPQPIELVQRKDPLATDLVYRIEPYEVYVKPENYDHTPFPSVFVNNGFTKDSGYVNAEDVAQTVSTYDDILNLNINTLDRNAYVWVGNVDLSWNIYKHIDTEFQITSVAGGDTSFEISLKSTPRNISIGDIIGIWDIAGVDGFYKVTDTGANTITLETQQTIANVSSAQGLITRFTSVRTSNLTQANIVAEDDTFENDLIWVDDDDSGEWAVLKNNHNYTVNQIESNVRTGTTQDFAHSISADDRNTVVAVGLPGDENGKVLIYTRPNESTSLQLKQTLEPVENICSPNQRFGESIAVSGDGNYILVGSPNASQVKTKFKGNFVESQDYSSGDIVISDEVIWQAQQDIEGAEPSIIFSSFDSVPQIIDELDLQAESATDITFIFTGNYPFTDISNVDHILVRAPKDQFDGSGINDSVYLKWNDLSYAYQDQDALTSTEPFDGVIAGIDKDFITGEHIIDDKIEAIIYIDAATNIPVVGDSVETISGFADVAYAYSDGASVSLYLKNINGVFDLTGSLIIQGSGDFVGEYVKNGPVEQEDTADVLGGYWLIRTPLYSVTDTTTDQGRGLVFQDVVSDSTVSDRYYYNILDFDTDVVSSENSLNSYIRVLSFQGFPGPGGSVSEFLSDLYVVRAPKALTDTVSPTDTIDFYVNPLARFSDGTFKDPADLNLDYATLNTTQTIYDIWDGYINFVYTKFDTNSNPFEPKVGQTVRDVTTGATAEVTYYQRNLNEVTIFVKNITGSWSQGDDYGDNAEIEFLQIPGDTDPIYQADRVMGQIQFRSLGLASEGIGQLLVFQADSDIALPDTDILLDAEYWFYDEDTVQGIPREASTPSDTNNAWSQIYNIPANTLGDTSYGTYTQQGMYTVFAKDGTAYTRINDYIVPEATDNMKLGADVKFAKLNDLYKGFVLAKGDYHPIETPSPSFVGRLYFIKNGSDGTEDYVWSLGKDKNYKGQFKTQASYSENNIVFKDGTLYKALTNISAGTFNESDWEETSELVDYIGYIPNDTDRMIGEDSSTVIDQQRINQFGSSYDTSKNGEVIAVGVLHDNSFGTEIPNKVIVYRSSNDQYVYAQEIEAPNINTAFASSVALSADGTLLAVGAPYNDVEENNQGSVYVYRQNNGVFVLNQTLSSPNNERGELFGSHLQFDGNILTVTAQNGSIQKFTELDSGATQLDNGFTRFATRRNQSGVVYIYERINNTLVYGQDLTIDNDINQIRNFGRYIKSIDNHIYVGLPRLSTSTVAQGTFIDYRRPRDSRIWDFYRQSKKTVDVNKLKKVSLYDTKESKLLQYLDYIDPIQGKIAGPAEQEIRYKTYYDPATYSIGTDAVNVKATNTWGSQQVGQVWWDLTNAKFVNPYQGNITFSTNNWNTLFTGNSIDVYEWVESEYLPSEWDDIADTEEGIRQGISGTSKYGDSVYVQKRLFDSAAQVFSNKYYFWVKNKTTIPAIESRNISVNSVAELIRDPKGQAYRFVAMISPDSFVLYNCESLIKDTDVAISFQYWTIDNQDINIHNEYKIISDGLDTSMPSKDIEQKWFDSLVGYDAYRRPVPDPNLSPKLRYGILTNPRQSWFINKAEALKQVIERTNSVLLKNLIVETRDITRLFENDEQPSEVSNLFDTTVDTQADLNFVGVARAIRAEITPVIEDGKIVRVVIANPGRGYRVAPTYEILGSGSGAEIEFAIDSVGKITSATVVKTGSNYTDSTTILVRRFTVLVENDETIQGKWALYERLTETRTWNRIESQAYDVSLFWNYQDWYDTGYSALTEINHLVDESYELTALDDNIGDVVKISSIGTGGWLLLEKIDNQANVDYTVNYKTIGRQNGTVQFTNTLYDVSENQSGFDSFSYDVKFYDSQPTTEVRVILETIKDEIFIDDLAIEYNQLFFASLRYVFAEQTNVDWAFKTSFVKAKHNTGELQQKINFQNDNLPSYEDYLKEAKPFKTKLREYVSAYEKLEPSESVITDFDLPPRYDSTYGRILPHSIKTDGETLSGVADDVQNYPNKHWLDSVGYAVQNIEIADGGTGFVSAPEISLTGGGGTGATARAYVGQGKITKVEVLTPGSGYLSAPEITINGTQTDGGTDPKLSVILGGSPKRLIHMTVKFDRVTGTYEITKLNETETFTGNARKTKFVLTWPMNLSINNVEVTINNALALRSTYTYYNEIDTSKGYDRYLGVIEFDDPPANNSTIAVSYKKAELLLNAQDRVNLYYNPQSGQYGNDLAQVMSGIDYGGVEVKSFDFGGPAGWMSEPWYTTGWDTYDNTYEDEVFRLDGSTLSLELSQPLENGVVYNIYRNNVRIDDPLFGTGNETNPNALMPSVTGNGIQQTINIGDYDIPAGTDDVFVIRKITSDGSFLPDPASYDTLVQGGDLSYQTATGINASEINIDGDGFVTSTTSAGPEEQVPGQILDTVDIQVYERPSSGASNITCRNYTGDGSATTFSIGTEPFTEDSLFVKLDNQIVRSGFTINFDDQTVTFDTAPVLGKKVTLLTLGVSGSNVLDIDEFTADGSTNDFLTNTRWTDDISHQVTVNGQTTSATIVQSDTTYEYPNNVVIRFSEPPASGEKIRYALFEGELQNYSEVLVDNFIADGSTTEFELSQTPFTSPSLQHSIIVKVNNSILNAGYNQNFTVSATREYQLDLWQIPVASISNEDIEVYLNDTQLEFLQDYSVEGAGAYDSSADPQTQAGSTVILANGVGDIGDTLRVFVKTDGEYTLNGSTLTLNSAQNDNDIITVYQFSNHDSQDFERISYDVVERTALTVGSSEYYTYHNLTNGLIALRRPAVDAQYVWVTLNGELLSPSVDYIVTENQRYVKMLNPLSENDVIELLHFANEPLVDKFGWRQFKDITNKTHYKRLDGDRNYVLQIPLNWYDKNITLVDATGLPDPDPTSNTPGVIFLEGERIEFFRKDGNVLKQLRRGTFGTGVKDTYAAGTEVYDQSIDTNAPYKDQTLSTVFVSDGTTGSFELDFTPASVNEFEVFVAGRRLRKNSIESYRFEYTDQLGTVISPDAQDSPEGDITLDPEFTLDGTTLELAEQPDENQKIIVIRKIGKLWSPSGTPLSQADTDIARFLREKTVDLPR